MNRARHSAIFREKLRFIIFILLHVQLQKANNSRENLSRHLVRHSSGNKGRRRKAWRRRKAQKAQKKKEAIQFLHLSPPITNHQSPITNHLSPITFHFSPLTSHLPHP